MSSDQATRRIGILLAAGRGRRMGRTKQLLTWPAKDGEKQLVAAAYDAIRPICDVVIVVLGHEADKVAAALAKRAFHRAESDPDAPMFESIRAGIVEALDLDSTAILVLHPGDHPAVEHSTLQTLVNWSLKRPAQAIIPEYGGRGGHPVLIPPTVAIQLREAVCPEGLGQFWNDHPKLCHRVAVEDAGVIRDIDTPDDLPS